jgi:hypothetical protein
MKGESPFLRVNKNIKIDKNGVFVAFGDQSGHYQSMISWFCDQFENGDDQTDHQKPQDPIFIFFNIFIHPSDFLVIHPSKRVNLLSRNSFTLRKG